MVKVFVPLPTLRIHSTGHGTGPRRRRANKSRRPCSSSRVSNISANSVPIEITYPGTNNYSTLAYDGLGRCVAITEVTGGTTSSIKQFVWCGNNRCEARDGSGNLLAQYFSRGQVNFSGSTGTSYYYTLDHLGSVREMTNSSGSIVYQQSFDSYGQPSVLVSTTAPDMGYAGYYVHARSGLNLTATRAYSATMGRFISRDPIKERGGVNLYRYVANNPMSFVDPNGTNLMTEIPNGAQMGNMAPTDASGYTGATQWNGNQASQSGQGSGWGGSDWQQPPPPPHGGGCSGGNNGDDGGPPPPPPPTIEVPPPLISILPPWIRIPKTQKTKKECDDDRDSHYSLCDQIADPVKRAECYEVANKLWEDCIKGAN